MPADSEKCTGGQEAHEAHLDVNGECPWCGVYDGDDQAAEPAPALTPPATASVKVLETGEVITGRLIRYFPDLGSAEIDTPLGSLIGENVPTPAGATVDGMSERMRWRGVEATRQLVAAVEAHAVANYEDSGWDMVVETMSKTEIEKVIGWSTTAAGAIKKVRQYIRPAASRRADIMATAF